MSYMSLYRRQRPLRFSQMVGQDHVSRTLSQALTGGRVAHAYLFCGPRGTGKTTTAKILARALNCDRYPAPEPCGECRSCRNILAGVSLDVLEMDAASNRGIDEIRELRERTLYASGEGRFKVYIIDEAHMLTTEAANAFLKTLEEPPPGVVFVLATTDPTRLPPTIISRCQRFNFHLLGADQVYRRLAEVALQEGWNAEPEALSIITHLAEGSLRDALGILEQAQPYRGEIITADHVRRITGVTRKESITGLLEAITENSLTGGLCILQEVISGGGDPYLLVKDLTYCLSRLLLPADAGGALSGGDYGLAQPVNRLRGKISPNKLIEAVELLHEVVIELRQGYSPQFILEMAMIRLLGVIHRSSGGPVMEIKGDSLPSKPVSAQLAGPTSPFKEQLRGEDSKRPAGREEPAPEREQPSTEREQPSTEREQPSTEREQPSTERGKPPAGREKPPAGEEQLPVIRKQWSQILDEVGKKQKSSGALLSLATVAGCRGNCILFSFEAGQEVLRTRLMETRHRKVIEGVLSRLLSGPVRIDTVNIQEVEPAPETLPSLELDEPEPAGGADLVEEAARMFNGKIFEAEKREG